MDFHWFGFGEPQSLEVVDDTLPTESQTVETSSSSSSSGESDTSHEDTKASHSRTKQHRPATYSQVWCGVTNFGVGRALIQDDSGNPSTLRSEDIPLKTVCGRRLSSTMQILETSQCNQVQAFCNHPGCRRAWHLVHKA